MHRLLKRSLDGAGGRKSGRRTVRSMPVEAGFQADGGGIGVERTPVPEPYRGLDVDDDEERLKVVDWAEKSRSLMQRVDQLSDSGCEAGVEATDSVGLRRRGVLERQNETTISSGTSSVVNPASSMSLGRFHRQRASLRSFRFRSEQFLRRRMRTSCLRSRGGENDYAYGPARRPCSDADEATVGGLLTASKTVIGVDGCKYVQQWLPHDATALSETRQSSRSDVMTVLSSVDGPVWNDHDSWMESPTSTTSSAFSHVQV